MAKRSLTKPDPRTVRGRYFNGYWRQEYTVIAIDKQHCLGETCWTVEWADGHVTHHGTAWDWKRDQVLA